MGQRVNNNALRLGLKHQPWKSSWSAKNNYTVNVVSDLYLTKNFDFLRKNKFSAANFKKMYIFSNAHTLRNSLNENLFFFSKFYLKFPYKPFKKKQHKFNKRSNVKLFLKKYIFNKFNILKKFFYKNNLDFLKNLLLEKLKNNNIDKFFCLLNYFNKILLKNKKTNLIYYIINFFFGKKNKLKKFFIKKKNRKNLKYKQKKIKKFKRLVLRKYPRQRIYKALPYTFEQIKYSFFFKNNFFNKYINNNNKTYNFLFKNILNKKYSKRFSIFRKFFYKKRKSIKKFEFNGILKKNYNLYKELLETSKNHYLKYRKDKRFNQNAEKRNRYVFWRNKNRFKFKRRVQKLLKKTELKKKTLAPNLKPVFCPRHLKKMRSLEFVLIRSLYINDFSFFFTTLSKIFELNYRKILPVLNHLKKMIKKVFLLNKKLLQKVINNREYQLLFNIKTGLNFLRGIKFQYTGKTKKASRSHIRTFQVGKIPQQHLLKKVNYYFFNTITPFGTSGIKVWIYNKKIC